MVRYLLRRVPSAVRTRASGGSRPRGSSTMRAGLGPATRRTVSCGSSATAVPMPTKTPSTSARSLWRCANPAGPLMYLEWPVTVAIRPSIDWPICPTTTRSSTAPRRSGPKRSSQGCGRGQSPVRKLLGTGNQCCALPLGSSGAASSLMSSRPALPATGRCGASIPCSSVINGRSWSGDFILPY